MTKTQNIAFIKARWHADIVDQALAGFEAESQLLGADWRLTPFDVPGAFEMPLLAQTLLSTDRYQAVVAAAFVVDGGIYRHDFVSSAVIDGLMRVQLDCAKPVFSVVLTPHHFQPTEEHRGFFRGHFAQKGAEAARAAVLGLIGREPRGVAA